MTTNDIQSWVPDSSFGFHNQLGSGITGYLSFSQTLPGEKDPYCPLVSDRPQNGVRYANYVYHDPIGKSHALNYTLDSCGTGPITTGDGSSSDGSGYSFNGRNVISSTGKIVSVPSNPTTVASTNGSITDSNGNTITNNGNGTFTDTLA